MKYFFPVLMFIVIAAGLGMMITPYIAEHLVPMPDKQTRMAKTEQLQMALGRWFNAPAGAFVDVQGMEVVRPDGKVAAFSFSVNRKPVEGFIRSKQLEQRELSESLLQTHFHTNDISASWWQPKALATETWFTGRDNDRQLNLIYNPKSRRGVLLIETLKGGAQ
jgi:hypothetical protein